MKKIISINIPCRNEKDNIKPLYESIIRIFEVELKEYDYHIQFIDNYSDDGTRDIIKRICEMDSRVCAIFNVKNFGYQSGFYGFLQTDGDCTINLAADFQDPIDLIPLMVKKWEKGATIVCAVKVKSKENKILFIMRTFYYKLLKKYSEYPIIEHFSGYGLYDKEFVDFVKKLDEPCPYMRGIVAEFGYNIEIVKFIQPKRRSGKSKNNFFSLFDIAMKSFTTYTKVGPRIATLIGFLCSGITFLCAVAYLIVKLLYWNKFSTGIAPILIGVFFMGSLQLFLIGLLGEYILTISERIKNRPLVIEEKRINMGDENDKKI